jgi:predicted nucleic acid-binding protein
LPILFEKRNLPSTDALDVLAELKCLIQIVDSSLYQLYEQDAKNRIAIRDINDWSIIALALMLDCPIWTEDNDFLVLEWLHGRAIAFTYT